ncbi:MAG TPA: FlgD immunoglobulin-like domain containing protein [Candidatus Cloacimonadota bacterium]|nr:FlgD immunoglobulin-like domain containing protein [Candidatus Cloacimonadota bacterium]
MKNKLTVAAILSVLLSLVYGYSQFDLLLTDMYVCAVSNDGMVSGYIEHEGPYYLWNPDTGQFTNIGGSSDSGGADFSADGNYLAGSAYTAFPSPEGGHHRGLEMARYNVSTGVWTTLGNLGMGPSVGWAISSDGKTVAGVAYDSVESISAVAWNESEGLINLGNDTTYTTVSDISYDGSIIVGFQLVNSSIGSAVWRKNPAGGYLPLEPLLLSPIESPDDPSQELGIPLAISASGEWIGGSGSSLTNYLPWIWSEATGCIVLGNLDDGEYVGGAVNGMDYHGNKVIGRFQETNKPPIPFIWTPEHGLRNLNTYATQSLGVGLAGTTIRSATISDNGEYIAGMTFDPSSDKERAYRLKIGNTSTPEEVLIPAALSLDRIYPNPFTDETKIEYNLKEAAPVRLSIYNQRGQLVRKLVSECKVAGTHTVSWNGSDTKGRKVSSGIYFAHLNSGNFNSQKKLIYLSD